MSVTVWEQKMDPRYKSPTTAVIDHDAEHEFRDLTTLTTVLVWMLRIGAALALLSLWSSWLQLELLSTEFSPDAGAANDRREGLVAGAAGIVMLATIIVFGRWIVLAHRNLPAMGAQHLEVRPGWAVGFFFIPILNWWKPYVAMRSLWRSSRSVHRPEIQDNTWVLPTWWGLWVSWSLLGNATWRMQGNARTITALTSLTQVELVASSLYLLVCVVASMMVSQIWNAQAQQRENPEAAPQGFADASA
jgi:Domain of unknown function (DUF4328)